MTITKEQLSHLCGVAGWRQNQADSFTGVWYEPDGRVRIPLESRDDAHAMLSAVVAKLGPEYRGEVIESVAAAFRRYDGESTGDPRRDWYWFLITFSADDLCAAMFAALPECPVCHGRREVPNEMFVARKCPACGGSGKGGGKECRINHAVVAGLGH